MTTTPQVVNPDKKIDCTGLFCPMPIVKTRDAIATMTVGEVLEMTSDDPGSEPDMKVWSQRSGHDLLEVSRHGGLFRFLVRKSH